MTNKLDILNEDNSINNDCDYFSYENLNEFKLEGDTLKVMHLNIHSFIAKKEKLTEILIELNETGIKLDVILLCETFINDTNIKKMKLKNYKLANYENRKNSKQGGVAIFLRKEIKFYSRKDLDIFIEGTFESCFVEIVTNNNRKNIILGEIYRVPNTNEKIFIKEYAQIIKQIKSENKELILGLDQNIDYLKVNSHKNANDFLDLNIDHNILPTINRPTRVTHNSATLIDNINISQNLSKSYKSAILTTDISDHYPCILLTRLNTKIRKEPIKFSSRQLNEHNINNIKQSLLVTNWETLNVLNANDSYNEFKNILNINLNRFAPESIKIINNNKIIKEEWMTPGLIKSAKNANKLFKKTIGKPRDCIDYKNYLNYRNKYNHIKRKAKLKYYQLKIREYKSDGKKLWSIMNEIIGKSRNKSNIIDYINLNGIKQYNQNKIANEFCKFFSHIGPNLSKNIKNAKHKFTHYMNNITIHSIFLQPTNEFEIFKLIKNLKCKNSHGDDKINNKIIKLLADEICVPLSIIFNKCLTEGIFPDKMKNAEVIPLHKGKTKHEMNNYRPVSLLTSTSKLLEKIIHERIYNFMVNNNLFNEFQFGFRKKCSTIDTITSFLGKLIQNIENKENTLGIYIDLSKAFDTINHNILLHKLHYLGIRGTANKLIKDYLTNRTQQVRLYNENSNIYCLSDKNDIVDGIPQGSVLGPLLFILYISDINNSLKNSLAYGFADDTTILISDTSFEDMYLKAYEELHNICDWFLANKLSINLNKTNYILFKKNKNKLNVPPDLIINNTLINKVSHTKFLGIIMDEEISWKLHVNYLLNRLRSNLYLFKSSKNTLPLAAKLNLYYAHVYSILIYGNIIWGPMISQGNKNKISKLQDKIILTFNKKYKKNNINKCYKELKILKFEEIIKHEAGKFLYNFKKGNVPIIINTIFEESQHNYNLRNSGIPRIGAHKSKLYNTSFLVYSIRSWNTITQITKHSNTLPTFKKRLKKELLDKY